MFESNGLKTVVLAAAAAGFLVMGGLAGTAIERGKGASADPDLAANEIIWGEHTVDETGVILVAARDAEDGDVPAEEIATAGPASQPVVASTAAPASPTPLAVQPTPAPAPVQPTPAATPEIKAAYVVSIEPADGAIGVARDASIEVTFSESMDQDSVESAFSLSSGDCGSFRWNSSQTVMSFNPCSDWPYGTEVTVEVGDGAVALSGAVLGKAFESEFRVLRQSKQTLYSEADYDGWVRSKEAPNFPGQVFLLTNGLAVSPWSRGFISFDLSELPADVVAVQFAEVGVFQHTASNAYGPETGSVLIESVSYGTLNYEDWFAYPHLMCSKICIGKNANLLSDDATLSWKTRNVSVAVNNDWQLRDNRDLRSQFRLRFQKECPTSCDEDTYVILYAGEGAGPRPFLKLTYTHP
ncbi:MAG TPA: Ig-like domain-containing protein [Dehalococcoidia bacterium]|nr:Ig-like domain-containing protein [Dehalococcoidia bacterium]